MIIIFLAFYFPCNIHLSLQLFRLSLCPSVTLEMAETEGACLFNTCIKYEACRHAPLSNAALFAGCLSNGQREKAETKVEKRGTATHSPRVGTPGQKKKESIVAMCVCCTVITINQQLLPGGGSADWSCYRCVLIL